MNATYTQLQPANASQGDPRGPMHAEPPSMPNRVNFTNPFQGQDGSIHSNAATVGHMSSVVTTEYEGYQIRKNEAVRVDGLAPTWDDAVIAKLQYTKARLIEMTSINKIRGFGDAERDLAAFKSVTVIHSVKKLLAQRNANEQQQQASWVLASVEPVRKERVSRKRRIRELDHVIVILKREKKQGWPGKSNVVHPQRPRTVQTLDVERANQQYQPYSEPPIEKRDNMSALGKDIVLCGPQIRSPPARLDAVANPQQAGVTPLPLPYHRPVERPPIPSPTQRQPHQHMYLQHDGNGPQGPRHQLELMRPRERPPLERRDFVVPIPPPAVHQDQPHLTVRDDEDYNSSDYSSDPADFVSNGGEFNQITPLSTPPLSPGENPSPRIKAYGEYFQETNRERFGKTERPVTRTNPHPQRERNSYPFVGTHGSPDDRALQRLSVGRDQQETKSITRLEHKDYDMPRHRQYSDPSDRALPLRTRRPNFDDDGDTRRPSRDRRDNGGSRRRYSSPADVGRHRRGVTAHPRRDRYESDRDTYRDPFARPKSYVWDRR